MAEDDGDHDELEREQLERSRKLKEMERLADWSVVWAVLAGVGLGGVVSIAANFAGAGAIAVVAMGLSALLTGVGVTAAVMQFRRDENRNASETASRLRDILANLASRMMEPLVVSTTADVAGASAELVKRLLSRVSREPENAEQVVGELDPAAAARLRLVGRLRSRARGSRLFSLLSIAGMVGAVLLAFLLFSDVDELVASLSAASAPIDEAEPGQATEAASAEAGDTSAVIALHITSRVGVLLLIVFGVQILHGVFRYMQRMAAFCDARADALDLSTDTQSFLELVGVLTPDVEFGNPPKSPTEHITKLVSDALERGKKDSSQTSA